MHYNLDDPGNPNDPNDPDDPDDPDQQWFMLSTPSRAYIIAIRTIIIAFVICSI